MRSNIQHYSHQFLTHFLLVAANKRMEILKLSSKKVAAVGGHLREVTKVVTGYLK